jgi:hypothetical protein
MIKNKLSSRSSISIVLISYIILCSPFAQGIANSQNNQVSVLKVTASSDGTQSEKWPHHPEMVVDGNRYTCWASSSTDIISSWLNFEFKEPIILSSIEIINGWIPLNYPDFFQKNHRAKQITITFDNGSQEIFTLEDNNDKQRFSLKNKIFTKFIKVKIDKIYQSQQGEIPWVTISEISFYK